MNIQNYKECTKNVIDAINLVKLGSNVVNSACRAVETEFEKEVVNECIQKAVDAALQQGNKWTDFPGGEDDAIDFGYSYYNFCYTMLCVYLIDQKESLTFKNNTMYNAFNNISMDTFYLYMQNTRVDLPHDSDELQYFNEMVLKYHTKTMSKLEAIQFVHRYTSYTKSLKFFKTGNFESDEDV